MEDNVPDFVSDLFYVVPKRSIADIVASC